MHSIDHVNQAIRRTRTPTRTNSTARTEPESASADGGKRSIRARLAEPGRVISEALREELWHTDGTNEFSDENV